MNNESPTADLNERSEEKEEHAPERNDETLSTHEENADLETESEPESESESEPEPSLQDLEDIFRRMKTAIRSVHSVSIFGNADNQNTIAGTTIQSTMEVKVDAMLEPFIQHAVYTVTGGEGGKSEWYATDEEMYLYMEDKGWQKTVHPLSIQAGNLLYRDDYFDHFILYKDLFELTEDDDHYVITYIGPDEQYKEVFYGNIMDQSLGEAMNEMNEWVANTKMSGAVEMKVSKVSFLIAEQHTVYKATAENFGMSMETIQDGTYVYSYNEVRDVEIPTEVIENANAP